jgi:hypothetical protein
MALAVLTAVTVHAQTPGPKVELSATEMDTNVTKIQKQLQEDLLYVTRLQAEVKKKQDVIKLNCINDRLVQLKAQLNIADERGVELRSAMGGDKSKTYGEIVEAGANGRRLVEEAKNCAGEPELFREGEGVEVTKPFMPDDLRRALANLDPDKPEDTTSERP